VSLSDIIKQLAALRTPEARRLFLEMRQEAFRKTVTRLTGQLRDGTMNLDAWAKAMKGEIKSLHTTSAAVGRGDWRSMSQSDWGKVGAEVKKQYQFLRGFVDDIAANDGKPFSARHIIRANMYGGAGRGSFERAQETLQVEEGGNTEYRWDLGVAEHCPDCVEYSQQGWVEAGSFEPAFPGSGHTVCLSNCKCRLTYR
jgi:hypothetical protein